MSSFMKQIKKTIVKNEDLLNALEEYDRTRKLRKLSYKTRVNFTVDEDLFNQFRSFCKQNDINMSAKIETFMKKELSKKIN
jgi:post-segregation antitoxin (ccd killing protein)